MAIPEGWRVATLGDFADVIMGQSPPGESYNEHGLGAPLINGPSEFGPHSPTPVQWTTEVTRTCEVGDVLFCVRGSTTGRQNRADQVYCIGRGIAAIRGRPYHCDTGYISHVLASISSEVLRRAKGAGSTFPNIGRDELTAWPTLLPPLPEQKTMAAILSSVDETIENTESVIAQLQIVKKAMMEQLLTKGMPGRHTRFKQTEIGEIPEEWEVVRAGELCEVITKGTTPKVVTSASPDCVPFLRVQNIGRRGEIDLSGSALFITERTHTTELMRSQIRPGDVLMNIVGPPLGKVAVVPISIPKANINQAIALLRPARIESEYLSLCLTAEHLFAWLLKQAKRTSTQLNLTLESCREFPLPLPDQAERREIIACTVAMQLTLDAQQTELVALREVKSSLSSSLLSGEIRVVPEVA